MLISLYTTRALLSILGIDDYGLYNVVCGFVTLFGFLNTSMANATQRFYNFDLGKNSGENISSVYTHALIIHFLIAIVVLCLIETIGLWYLKNKMVIPYERYDVAFAIFQFAIVDLFVSILTVPYSAAVMAYEKMNFYAVVSIFDSVLKLIIVLLLPFGEYDNLFLYGILSASISIFNLLIYYIYCKRTFKTITLKNSFDKSLFFSLVSFSGWNLLGSAAHLGKSQGVNLLLNAFWGTVANAANGVASLINGAVSSLTSSFVTAIRPQMIKCYASGDMSYLMKMLYSTSKMTFFLVLILSIPIVVEMKPILDIWLGTEKYPEFTVEYCQLTALMVLFNSFANPISIIVHASGKMRNFQIVCSLVVFSIVPLSYVAAKMGCDSIFIFVLEIIVVIVTQLTRLFMIKTIIEFSIIRYFHEVFYYTMIVCIVSFSLSFLLKQVIPPSIVGIFCIIVLSIFTTAVVIYFAGLSHSEKKLLLSFFNK